MPLALGMVADGHTPNSPKSNLFTNKRYKALFIPRRSDAGQIVYLLLL